MTRKLSTISSLLPVMGILLTLQACAVSPQRSATALPSVNSMVVQQATELDSLSEGDTVIFYAGLLEPYGHVTIGHEYHSASGRLCKRILDASSQELVSLACKVKKEQWYVRQPLTTTSSAVKHRTNKSTASNSEFKVPATGWKNNAADNAVGEEISYTLEQGETLWSFSQRTTGNALNWEAIAQYNSVDNTSTLAAGMSLLVPSVLNSNGR